MDPITLMNALGLAAGGGSALLQAMGVIKSPEEKAQEKDEARRKAMAQYIQANVGDFNYEDKPYNEADYKAQLDPMRERLTGQAGAMANNMALGGQARGGVSQALALSQLRKGNEDIGNAGQRLYSQDKGDAFNRALQMYQTKLSKAQLMAGLQ